METKQKTLAQCKDEVAKQYSYMGNPYKSWEAMQNTMLYDVPESSKRSALKDLIIRSDEADKLYASEENRKKEPFSSMKWVKCSDHLPGYVNALHEMNDSHIIIRRIDNKSVIKEYFNLHGKEWGLENFEWLDEQSQQPLSIAWLSEDEIKKFGSNLYQKLHDRQSMEGRSTNGMIQNLVRDIQSELKNRVVDPVDLLKWFQKETSEGGKYWEMHTEEGKKLSFKKMVQLYIESKTK